MGLVVENRGEGISNFGLVIVIFEIRTAVAKSPSCSIRCITFSSTFPYVHIKENMNFNFILVYSHSPLA